jgi:hypothetical protein
MGACFSRSVALNTSRINLRAADHAGAHAPRALPIHEFLPPNHPKPVDHYCCKVFEALSEVGPSRVHGESSVDTVLERQGVSALIQKTLQNTLMLMCRFCGRNPTRFITLSRENYLPLFSFATGSSAS